MKLTKDATRPLTLVLATSQLSVAQEADEVVLISEGSVVDVGPHAELLKKKGEYARLIELQQGFNIGEDGNLCISAQRLGLL